MSKYIENNLGKDEAIVLKAKKNPLYLLGGLIPLIIFIIIAVVLTNLIDGLFNDAGPNVDSSVAGDINLWIWIVSLVIGILPIVVKLCTFLSINLAVTNKRVIGKIGLLRINSLDIHIDKIDHVQVKASILGNIFHYYKLSVYSAGGAGFDNDGGSAFVAISNAQEFKNTVNSAIEKHAEEARKAQASEIASAMSTGKRS